VGDWGSDALCRWELGEFRRLLQVTAILRKE
jgi:hypothetical protein